MEGMLNSKKQNLVPVCIELHKDGDNTAYGKDDPLIQETIHE